MEFYPYVFGLSSGDWWPNPASELSALLSIILLISETLYINNKREDWKAPFQYKVADIMWRI